jgi:threonine synthase
VSRGERWREVCSGCGRTWALTDLRWECSCGGLLDLVGPLTDPLAARAGPLGSESPLERYRVALPAGAGGVDLGLVPTPLEEVAPGRFVKADYEQPTGSFKDRGAAVMIGAAAELGVRSIVVDSSGNAGRAAAAHASAAGVECRIFVPAGIHPAKVESMVAFGASVVEVPGDRTATAAAAREALKGGAWYASHVHQPLFHHGVKTLAYELFEQIPGIDRVTVVVPAGNGTLVLGLWIGFGELVALGRLSRRPVLMAVQAERCAPLAGLDPDGAGTVATGIAIPAPARAPQIRGAIMATGGRVLTVSEQAIGSARVELAGWGFEVEPTGAVAWAGASSVPSPSVAILTGRA